MSLIPRLALRGNFVDALLLLTGCTGSDRSSMTAAAAVPLLLLLRLVRRGSRALDRLVVAVVSTVVLDAVDIYDMLRSGRWRVRTLLVRLGTRRSAVASPGGVAWESSSVGGSGCSVGICNDF